MPRRALTRGSVAAATVVVMAAGLAPAVTGGTAYADGTPSGTASQETVIPAGSRWLPQSEPLITAGNDGYLVRGANGAHWVNPADGSEGPVLPDPTPPLVNTGLSAHLIRNFPSQSVTITDYDTNTFRTVTAPAGQRWVPFGFSLDRVLTSETAADGTLAALHVIGDGKDGSADLTVTGLPPGTAVPDWPDLLAQNRDHAVLRLTSGAAPGTAHAYLLDYRTGTLRAILADVPAAEQTTVVLGRDRVLAYGGAATTAYTVRLDDPTAPVEKTPLPTDGRDGTPKLTVTGDRVLVLERSTDSQSAGLPLRAVPVGGGPARTLLAKVATDMATAPDGSVLVEGGTGPDDWAVRRITAADGADATVTDLKTLPPVAATVYGLSYSAGRLAYSDTTRPYPALVRRDVAAGPAPAVSEPELLWSYGPKPADCGSGVACVHLQGTGTGTVAFSAANIITVPQPPSPTDSRAVFLGAPGTVTDAAGPYVVVHTGTPARQKVFDLRYDGTLFDGPVTASALWGRTLWVPGSATGTVRPYDLERRTYGATVQTGAPCVPKELQADGRWLYWSCGTSAGVHDRTTGKNVPVPTGTALLGDGYVVRHDTTAGRLMLTDVHTGSAVGSNLAELAASDLADDRGVRWTVDKYGGGVVYVDAQHRFHVQPLTSIPRSAVSVLSSDVGPAVVDVLDNPEDWYGRWTLSRPVAGWSLTVTDEAGRTVATRRGSKGAQVSASWNLKGADGAWVRNGRYTWTLTAPPADGGPGGLSLTGLIVVKGAAGVHDFTGDGTGDFFGLTPSGRLDLRAGNGKGNVNAARSTSGWPTSSLYVPYGDLSGDRVNDLLVRDASGQLWRYDGKAGTNFTPSQPRTLIGPGWNAYDALASVGDLTGDGRADLVARTPSGSLYLYAADRNGRFGPRTLIGGGWNTYNLLIGSQHSESVGYGRQLLARDKSGVLWAYDGDGKGHFGPRVKIGSGWNIYNSIVGVGEIRPVRGAYLTGLVARDAAGDLWRYDGRDSEPGFAARVRLGAGWQMYKSLF
ncbi:FG-GAP-like repeat-containing protein [Streptomyces sp. NPDC088197]|uniref:FG-GAP-like repeat-containing protein n=1 Tax=Streptomyces sp. NPDC088197 TaxID=3365840 RepID=UPI0037F73A8E